MEPKRITQINGPVVVATGEEDFAMHDMVYLGEEHTLGEVIKIDGDHSVIQSYEDTAGMKLNEIVQGTHEPLSVWLGPGLIGNVFDGIERPLAKLKENSGPFIKRGVNLPGIDLTKKWTFKPLVKVGDEISYHTILGTVVETESINHQILYPHQERGILCEIVNQGEYTVKDIIGKVKSETGEIISLSMAQKWPIRKQRPFAQRLPATIPLLTGQRVIDTLFPLAKGGTATIPGGFGTGKTMLQHQLAKWSDADIIIYIGCGERGNEMTQVLEDFPQLMDPKTGRPLMDRTILIANTSNMPVAAREASIYTGITIAEYYRDMGYQVAVMADSTSRWAEALREISGRLEEMPAEEGFPSYLPSRLSEFYGRAGRTLNYNQTEGSVTIIGAVSPQGSDFSEPVTQNTRRFVHVFWGLDRELAYSRHYPAINWMISYSEYIDQLTDWYEQKEGEEFIRNRAQMIELLNEESELNEISKVVGQDVLSEDKKLVLMICESIKKGFLQQSAVSHIDMAVPLDKQVKMLKMIIDLYTKTLDLVQKGIPVSKIQETGIFREYNKIKDEVPNGNLELLRQKEDEMEKKLKELERSYQDHLG
jgi:V/A-type H+-transporting ATPase subunit A